MHVKTILFAILVLFAAQVAAQKVADDRGFYVKIGDKAPDFTTTLTNGKVVKLSDYIGKTVMLQFTASWCGVCRKEMPFIESDIWQKHKSNPKFTLIGIDRDEPLETVKDMIAVTGISYPIGLDPKAKIFALYADTASGVTRNVLIGKDGKIVLLTRLFNPDEFRKLCDKIDSQLK